jgi:uncharacterized membrane protein YciS (DUF1049 family)
MSETQSAADHAKMVPMYHYVTFLCIFVPTVYFIVGAVRDFSVGALMTAIFGVGVILGTFFARVFPLGVQDRVIRLEERIRLERVLPEGMRGRIPEISTDHLIGLRFASDEELAGLVQRVLDGELADRKSIKQAIRSWRADYQRI